MSKSKIPNLQEGKLIKEIDFQILMCKEKIKNHQENITKIKKMACMDGPSGIKPIDYSGIPHAKFSHIDFVNALDLIKADEEHIAHAQTSIKKLRRRRRNLIKAAEILEGTEQSVFIYRVIYGMTQEAAAEAVGISYRQLQRIEQQMRKNTTVFGL